MTTQLEAHGGAAVSSSDLVLPAYILVKQRGDGISTHRFATEAELREHLEAMWKFTDWHLVSISQMVWQNDKLCREQGGKDSDDR